MDGNKPRDTANSQKKPRQIHTQKRKLKPKSPLHSAHAAAVACGHHDYRRRCCARLDSTRPGSRVLGVRRCLLACLLAPSLPRPLLALRYFYAGVRLMCSERRGRSLSLSDALGSQIARFLPRLSLCLRAPSFLFLATPTRAAARTPVPKPPKHAMNATLCCCC